ncbi:MAG TPA: FGGY family carbohydrate kinase, partial [Verrucomicrobiae bacterium]|nr:FGGY family carbohydrate kinase [Verrucomicrobiae bacterium]
MEHFFVACDLGVENGRVTLASLNKGKLVLSEIRKFQNAPSREKNSIYWNVPALYREIIEGLRAVGSHEEPVHSVSCTSWGADYLLFEPDGTLITPTFHHADPRGESGMNQVLSKIPWETIYEETGVQKNPSNTLSQLGAEKSKRIHRKNLLMPVADGFNYLLSGIARVEMSQASATQLFDPANKTWSGRLLEAMALPPEIFPPVVAAGTKLGALRPDIARETRLEDVEIVASCSHESAAALVGLPVAEKESWAFLQMGSSGTIGTQLLAPIVNDISREWNFTNQLGHGGSVRFSKPVPGLWVLDECKRFWKERDREIDDDLLGHLATSSEPFESLIDFADPRFASPGEMPLKIQAFCKETGQPVPRRPGPVARCVLESLALMYRRTLQEMEYVTGRRFTRLYFFGGSRHRLLNHFTANALEIPAVIVPENITSIGSIVVQALATGQIK